MLALSKDLLYSGWISMPLVQAKCTNCGSSLQVDKSKDAAICPCCGTPYIVEKAINYFNLSSVGNSDFVIVGGVLQKYVGADLEIRIPDNVIEIGENAFQGCRYIKSVDCSHSVRIINNYAFNNCQSLFNVVVSNNLEYIGFGAFGNCTSLNRINIPNTVKFIGRYAFSKCSSIKELNLPDHLERIAENSFQGCVSLERIRIPNCVKTIEAYAFEGCKSLKELFIPLNTEIDILAFCNNPQLKLMIPTSMNQVLRMGVAMEKNNMSLSLLSCGWSYDSDSDAYHDLIHYYQNEPVELVFVGFNSTISDSINYKERVSKLWCSFVPYKFFYNYEGKSDRESDFKLFSPDTDNNYEKLRSLFASLGIINYSIEKISRPIIKHIENVKSGLLGSYVEHEYRQEGTRDFLLIRIPQFV